MREKLRATMAACALALFPAVAMSEDNDINGRWISIAPEPQGGIFALREFRIHEPRFSVIFRAFSDADATVPLFRINVSGYFVLGGPSPEVDDAREGIFPLLDREVTAESQAGVEMFRSMGCALDEGVTVSLVDVGCGFLPPLMEAMGEYDLVSLQGDQLFFGDRSGDLTKVRPSMLTPFPLERHWH